MRATGRSRLERSTPFTLRQRQGLAVRKKRKRGPKRFGLYSGWPPLDWPWVTGAERWMGYFLGAFRDKLAPRCCPGFPPPLISYFTPSCPVLAFLNSFSAFRSLWDALSFDLSAPSLSALLPLPKQSRTSAFWLCLSPPRTLHLHREPQQWPNNNLKQLCHRPPLLSSPPSALQHNSLPRFPKRPPSAHLITSSASGKAAASVAQLLSSSM